LGEAVFGAPVDAFLRGAGDDRGELGMGGLLKRGGNLVGAERA
jgi:hypothetical protein